MRCRVDLTKLMIVAQTSPVAVRVLCGSVNVDVVTSDRLYLKLDWILVITPVLAAVGEIDG